MAAFTFDNAKHEYRDEFGTVVPSVTQVLRAAGLIDFSMVSPAVLERKARLGTLVHQAVELYSRGENLADFDIPEEVWEYFNGYANFREDTGFSPDLIEYGNIATVNGQKYGMRCDQVGLVNSEPHIIELKTGAAVHAAWGPQMSGYELGLPKPLPHGRYKRAALQLGPQFPRNYKLHPFDDPSDKHIFQAALALTTWKQNNKLYISEDVPERLVARSYLWCRPTFQR